MEISKKSVDMVQAAIRGCFTLDLDKALSLLKKYDPSFEMPEGWAAGVEAKFEDQARSLIEQRISHTAALDALNFIR
jgi:hypothetical protein